MTDQLLAPEDKRRLWTARIAAWESSGLSQQKYCDQAQLTYSRFVYWRGRLKQLNTDDGDSGKISFVSVKLKKKTTSTLYLKISDQYSIEIHAGFDPDLLGQVIRTARQVQ